VDRVQIQQVLVNLLRNAIEAMEETAQRELTLTVSVQPNDRVEVVVADTGHGITDTMASQLFKPFVTTKDHGMGIGLAISKTIVETHGSTLTAEPNPGGGTIFRFTVPADPSDSR
jgi:two-component system sensor kinase FixL